MSESAMGPAEPLKRFEEPLTGRRLVGLLEGKTSSLAAIVPVGVAVDLSSVEALIEGVTSKASAREAEAEIAVALHSSLSAKLQRRQFSDPRLWHWLTAVRFPTFVEHRWGVPELSNPDAGWTQRWLGSATAAGFSRNALARLFFAAELLVDSGQPTDPYRLTRDILAPTGQADAFVSIFERRMSLHPAVARACVRHFQDIDGDEVKQKAKNLNLRLALLAVDALCEDDVEALLQSA